MAARFSGKPAVRISTSGDKSRYSSAVSTLIAGVSDKQEAVGASEIHSPTIFAPQFGMPAANAPTAPLASSTTLCTTPRPQVRFMSATNPGMVACLQSEGRTSVCAHSVEHAYKRNHDHCRHAEMKNQWKSSNRSQQ